MGCAPSLPSYVAIGDDRTRLQASRSVEIQTWLQTKDCGGTGPRPDQIKAFEWFAGNGWIPQYPLQYHAMTGNVAELRALLVSGMDPNHKMDVWFQSEPLGWAASFGQLACIILLIQFGADPLRPPNTARQTPLSDAMRERHERVILFLQEYQSRITAMVQRGPDYLNYLPQYDFSKVPAIAVPVPPYGVPEPASAVDPVDGTTLTPFTKPLPRVTAMAASAPPYGVAQP